MLTELLLVSAISAGVPAHGPAKVCPTKVYGQWVARAYARNHADDAKWGEASRTLGKAVVIGRHAINFFGRVCRVQGAPEEEFNDVSDDLTMRFRCAGSQDELAFDVGRSCKSIGAEPDGSDGIGWALTRRGTKLDRGEPEPLTTPRAAGPPGGASPEVCPTRAFGHWTATSFTQSRDSPMPTEEAKGGIGAMIDITPHRVTFGGLVCLMAGPPTEMPDSKYRRYPVRLEFRCPTNFTPPPLLIGRSRKRILALELGGVTHTLTRR